MSTLPINNLNVDRNILQSYTETPQRPNTTNNAQRYLDIQKVNQKLNEFERTKFNNMM